MPALFLLINTVNLYQSTPNSFYPYYQSALSRTLLRFCGTTFVETAVHDLHSLFVCGLWSSLPRIQWFWYHKLWLRFSNVPNHVSAVPPWWQHPHATGKRPYVSLFPDRPTDITFSFTPSNSLRYGVHKSSAKWVNSAAKWTTQWKRSGSRPPRLDYQPLFGKGARALEKAAEIEPTGNHLSL